MFQNGGHNTGDNNVELEAGTLLLTAYVLYVIMYFNLNIIFNVGTTISFPQYCLWSPCLPYAPSRLQKAVSPLFFLCLANLTHASKKSQCSSSNNDNSFDLMGGCYVPTTHGAAKSFTFSYSIFTTLEDRY